jgi:hypothetical protein
MAAIMKTAVASSAQAKPSNAVPRPRGTVADAAAHDRIRNLRSNITISGFPDEPAKPPSEGRRRIIGATGWRASLRTS